MQDITISHTGEFEPSENSLEKNNKNAFLHLMGGAIQWRSEDRKTATELLRDTWLKEETI